MKVNFFGHDVYKGWNVGVVIPAKNEELFIKGVLDTIPAIVDNVVVINDGSTDNTKRIVEGYDCKDYELSLINTDGKGVGAAIDYGHRKLCEINEDIPFVSVVMAGDGQMDPDDLPQLVEPIISKGADFVKGNRFIHHDGVDSMPLIRKIASIMLAFFTTLACGIKIGDPQCGYTATSHEVLRKWNWKKSWKGYGYPNYWLINLAMNHYSIFEAPVRAVYGEEKSGIKMLSFFTRVGRMMFVLHHKRCIKMLLSKDITPHIIIALTCYLLGWIALLPPFTTDLHTELTARGVPLVLVTLAFWYCAHIFDRLAMKTVKELRANAQNR